MDRFTLDVVSIRRAFCWLALALAVWTAAPDDVSASCTWPELRLLWSYPAEGADDVPLNASIWTATSGGATFVRAELNGRSLATQEVTYAAQRFDPSRLKPKTAYKLLLTYQVVSVSGAAEERKLELHFKTGSRQAAPATAPTISASSDSAPEDTSAHACQAQLAAQGCFDTLGPTPNRVLKLEITSSSALAWLVEGAGQDARQLWPADCGSAHLLIVQARANECVGVRAVGVGGLVSDPARHCHALSASPKTAALAAAASSVPPLADATVADALSERPTDASSNRGGGMCSALPGLGGSSLLPFPSVLLLLVGTRWRLGGNRGRDRRRRGARDRLENGLLSRICGLIPAQAGNPRTTGSPP